MEISNFKLLEKGGLIAVFDVYLPKTQLYLHGLSLCKTKDARYFISMPSKEYEKDGEKKYWPHMKFTKDMHEKFEGYLMSKLHALVTEEQLKKNKPAQQPVSKSAVEFDDLPF